MAKLAFVFPGQGAKKAGMGLSRTRAGGVRSLLSLARSEASLTPFDKIRLRIIREEGDAIRDLSARLVPIPAPAT